MHAGLPVSSQSIGDPSPEHDLRDHQLWQRLVPALRDGVEGESKFLGLAGCKGTGSLADDRNRLAEHELSIGIVEHAIDLDYVYGSRPVIGDLADNFDHLLLH